MDKMSEKEKVQMELSRLWDEAEELRKVFSDKIVELGRLLYEIQECDNVYSDMLAKANKLVEKYSNDPYARMSENDSAEHRSCTEAALAADKKRSELLKVFNAKNENFRQKYGRSLHIIVHEDNKKKYIEWRKG